MRVLFVINSLAYGGAETQLVRVATRLKQRGWEVRIVTLLPSKAYAEELESVGIPAATLRMRRKVPDPRAILRLASIIREWKPDIVHSHMVHANILARVTRLIAPVSVLICSIRSIYEGSRAREILYRLTDPLCDISTHVCQVGAERFVRVGAVPAHKMRYLPNGVDPTIFAPDAEVRRKIRADLGVENAFAWLAVARFEEPKDHFTMVRAFAMLPAPSQARSVLLLAGDGPLRAQIEDEASTLGVQSRVRFLGIRRDIANLMNASDAYVMSSAWEGLPNVLLEAHACGLPIVATDVGGNREIVADGVTGFLVPPRQPEALARAMEQMMQMEEQARRQMGDRGREHIVQNYSLEHVVQRWESLYRELLIRKGSQ